MKLFRIVIHGYGALSRDSVWSIEDGFETIPTVNFKSNTGHRKPGPPNPVTRRSALKQIVGIAAATAAADAAVPGARAAAPAPESSGVVRRENARPGTRDWQLSRTAVDPATKYRCPWIEGYVSRTSVRPGETLSFHVSTNPAASFRIDLYRMGYYGGAGARHTAELGPFTGRVQPDPPVGENRLRDCRWEPCVEWTIPSDWVSGVYLGKLTTQPAGWQSYVIFIVRDDREADFLFQCSDTTWQAYNRWPSQFSLYDNGAHSWWWGGDVRISFNRPYGKYCQIVDAPLSTGSGEFLLWEFPLVHWLEANGYDVSYVSNLDTHSNPDELSRAKGFLSVGHDEYWSIEMFRHVERAIRHHGVNAAFLSGNAVCGRVRFTPDTAGNPNRVMERVGVFGPPNGTREFVAINSLPHERPYANELIGAHSTGPVTGGADWICAAPDHWLFEGTRMRKGDGIPGLVGWEWHGDPAPIAGLEIVATGPTYSGPGQPNGGIYTATVYEGPHRNIVFNAATIWWGDGLSEPPGYLRPSVYTTPRGPNRRVQQITKNLLARMRK